MNLKQSLIGSGILLILGSCSTSQDAITNSPFQKRKYRSGWHVNLNTGDRHHTVSAPEGRERRAWSDERPTVEIRHEVLSSTQQVTSAEPVSAQVLKAQSPTAQAPPSADLSASLKTLSLNDRSDKTATEQPVRSATVASAAAPGDEGTNDKMNGMAIAGFVSSFFIPLLGIIFSAIALGQIKRRGGRGHGLAVAGLVISIATILILLAIL